MLVRNSETENKSRKKGVKSASRLYSKSNNIWWQTNALKGLRVIRVLGLGVTICGQMNCLLEVWVLRVLFWLIIEIQLLNKA